MFTGTLFYFTKRFVSGTLHLCKHHQALLSSGPQQPFLKSSLSHSTNVLKVVENSEVDQSSMEYQENKAFYETGYKKFDETQQKALVRSSEKAIKRHKSLNKLLMEERLSSLLDDRNEFLEIATLAGVDMPYGDVPRAGTITGIGKVGGRYCVVMVNDGTIKGGTIYPITLKKQLRCQEIAQQNRLPCIYVIDSGGAFLPLQSEIFPDKNQGGRVFYNIAIMSSLGIPQVSVVVGNCTAGAAYIPMMSDEAIIVDNVGRIFLGGPPLVQAATGEVISSEDLGGAMLHSSVSGCTDYFSETEAAAYDTCRDVVTTITSNVSLPTETVDFEEPLYDIADIVGLIPAHKQHQLDVYKVIARLVDGSKFHEFKKLFGPTLVTGYGYIKGLLIGIIGNNGEMTQQASDKGAHFVKLCSERDIPLLFLCNTHPLDCYTSKIDDTSNSNKIRSLSNMLAEVSCSQVPKITLVIGNSFGVPSYAMGGRCVSANFRFLWPNAQFGHMDQDLLYESIKVSSGEVNEKTLTNMKERLRHETSAVYSSTNLYDDGIITPENSRQVLAQCLSIFTHRIPVKNSSNAPIIRL